MLPQFDDTYHSSDTIKLPLIVCTPLFHPKSINMQRSGNHEGHTFITEINRAVYVISKIRHGDTSRASWSYYRPKDHQRSSAIIPHVSAIP